MKQTVTVWRGKLRTDKGAVEAIVRVDGAAIIERNKGNIAVALDRGQRKLAASDGAVIIELDPGEVED